MIYTKHSGKISKKGDGLLALAGEGERLSSYHTLGPYNLKKGILVRLWRKGARDRGVWAPYSYATATDCLAGRW